MLEIDVIVIVAIDVPNARCMTSDIGKPCAANSMNNKGTIVSPPPTPNNPAINPEKVPKITYVNNHQLIQILYF